jgi:hypothetical protein
MSVFVVVLAVLGGVWGLLTLIGYELIDKRCAGCKYYGDSYYMHKDDNGKYWHFGCYSEPPTK